MAKILFFPDVYQEEGHWLPIVTLAQNIRNRGHEVAFMGIADCEHIIEPYFYKNESNPIFKTIFQNTYPLGYTRSNPHKSISERWKPAHLLDIVNGGLDELINNTFTPDLIVGGYFASLETLLMHYRYGIKFIITTTYLRHPDDDPGVRALQNLFGMPEPMSRKILEDSAYKEADEIEFDENIFYNFVKPLEETFELIPCPREFQFDNYKFDSDIDPVNGLVKFVEPCVVRHLYGPSSSEWMNGIDHNILYAPEKRLIFATVGSQAQDYKDTARRWFEQMILMMKSPGMQDFHLLISMGPDLIREEWELPNNVTIHSWVPQFNVLDFCVAAFIHGGLATIKECIYKNVPFVILPHGKDQMDNALRMLRTDIGHLAHAEVSTSGDLQDMFLRNFRQNKIAGE